MFSEDKTDRKTPCQLQRSNKIPEIFSQLHIDDTRMIMEECMCILSPAAHSSDCVHLSTPYSFPAKYLVVQCTQYFLIQELLHSTFEPIYFIIHGVIKSAISGLRPLYNYVNKIYDNNNYYVKYFSVNIGPVHSFHYLHISLKMLIVSIL